MKYHAEADQLYYDSLDVETLVEDINSRKPRSYGLSGPNDYVVKNGSKRASVPLEFLDPGIALLVKVLPLYNIHSVYSCDGHGQNNPMICFVNYHYLDMCKELLLTLFPEYSSSIIFLREPLNWMGNKIEFKLDEEDSYRTFWMIHDIARRLMNKDLQSMYERMRP